MPFQPVDPVQLLSLISEAIAEKFRAIAHMGPVHTRNRFPETDDEDVLFFTTPDPVLGAHRPITNTVEISLPGWAEESYTSETSTSLTLRFGITYSLGVTDVWDQSGGYEFGSSAEQFSATCMRARLEFKKDRELGLGPNVFHGYLQGGDPTFATNDKGEATEHVIDMSLTVTVEGIKV